MSTRHCPALLIAAPASGQGKTTITAALAARARAQGKRVRVFKTGPDFIDPMILERASGAPVYQLDLWMVGEAQCRQLLYEAAGAADLILVEGVMGLFDGQPSSADLAQRFGLPVLAVVDACAMAQTFGAVAYGLARLRPSLPFAGAFANRVAGERHAAMLGEALPADVPLLGWLPRESGFELPDRHLGLVQAEEIADLDARLQAAAAALRLSAEFAPAPVCFEPQPGASPPALLAARRIAVARDAAFSFLYRANLDLLSALGAELSFFSPLADTTLPEADAVWLPGGYPELHLARLAANTSMLDALRRFHAENRPMLAECGGMLYLLEALTDVQGQRVPLAGLITGEAAMQPRLTALALQSATLPEGPLRGHSFHYSRLHGGPAPLARGVCPNGSPAAEAVFRIGRLTASYIHFYFPSNPAAVAQLFRP